MLTGPALGQAIEKAIKKKGVTKAAVARHFGITPPSVQDWIKFGRVGKHHIAGLVDYFSDVVGNEHWGLAPGQLQPGMAAEAHEKADAATIVQTVAALERDGRLTLAVAEAVMAVLKTAPQGKYRAKAAEPTGVTQRHTTDEVVARMDMETNKERQVAFKDRTLKVIKQPKNIQEDADKKNSRQE